VLMKADLNPKSSFKTFTNGARQLVVQLALETMLCFTGS